MRGAGKSGAATRRLLYYITDGGRGPAFVLERIREGCAAGVDLIQLREKQLSARDQFELACEAAAIVKGKPTHLLINDRLDIALAAGAHGVHLPAAGLPIAAVKAAVPATFLVARSCHSAEEVLQAAAEGADFAVLGPIYPTPSKLGEGAPLGVEVFGQLQAVAMPVLALGGIDIRRATECFAAGAGGIAAIRLFQEGSVAETVARLRKALVAKP